MPDLGTLPSLPYEQSNEAALYRFAGALQQLAQVKQTLAEQQTQSQLTQLLMAGGGPEQTRANLLNMLAQGQGSPRGGILGYLAQAVNPFAPARGASPTQRSLVLSLLGQQLSPQKGDLAWREQYLGESPEEARESVAIAAGRKAKATTQGTSNVNALRLLNQQYAMTRQQRDADPVVLRAWNDVRLFGGKDAHPEVAKALWKHYEDTLKPWDLKLRTIQERIDAMVTEMGPPGSEGQAGETDEYEEGQSAYNPETGERVIYQNGAWVAP